MKYERLVFFDGYCNLCNSFLDFLIRRDRKRRMVYTSLQGETVQDYLSEEERNKYDSVIFYESGKVYFRSSAALRAIATLGGLWKLALVFLVVPPFIRNAVYDWVARNRFSWFGRRDTCRLPTEEEKAYLLP